VPLLASLVSHENDNVAVAAIEALGRIGGPRAVQTLLAAVRSGNFFRVFPAIDVLGRSSDPRAIPPLAALLSDPTYVLEAARALGKTGEPAAVPPLAALLSHPSESVARVAAVSLWELDSRHAERYGTTQAPSEALRNAAPGEAAIRRLVRGLGTANPGEQLAIALVLGIVGGPSAVTGLRGLLDVPGTVSEVAAAALKRMGADSDVHLREAIRDGSSARRFVLLPVIGRAAATDEIVACLRDDDPTVRALACDALARVGATSSVPALFELLEDASPRVVQAAIGAIQSLGNSATKPLALAAAKHANKAVRKSALRILAYFGYTEALPLFLEAAKDDEDPRTRDAGLMGLAFLDDPRALEALLATSRAPLEAARSSAMRALGQCSRRDARIAAYLLTGLKDPGAWVRYYACQALGRLGVESATDAVAKLLQDPAGQVRVAAIEALSHFPNETALDALRLAAEGTEPDVQRAALIGLGIAKRPEGIAVILKAAHSADPATRLVAISAIADSASPHALPALSSAARDPDENVRAAAAGFLAGIPSVEATAVLVDLLRDEALRARILPLLSVPNEGRVSGIVAALAASDDELAGDLTSALVRLRSREAATALLDAMTLPWVPARKAAASALASMRTPEALEALRHAAESDPDPQVRQISAVLLGQ
jgi:HEAT repeat protein